MSSDETPPRRDVVVVLHPELPQVLVGSGAAVDVPVPDGPPSWPELLAAVLAVAPGGAWPTGPQRQLAGLRVHVVQARTDGVAAGRRWGDEPDPSWPEPLQEAVRTSLAEDAGTAAVPPSRAGWTRRGWWTDATAWVDSRLAGRGVRRTGELEPREHWCVSAVALPLALVHGDYHPWNVARPEPWTASEAVVLDWSDAAIGPAGVDLTTLFPRSAGEPERGPVRQAYAAVWAAHLDASPAEVAAEVAAAATAGFVVQASAYDELLRAVEPVTRWQLSGPMADRLRDLVGCIA